MSSFVVSSVARGCKTSGAYLALIGFFFGVNPLMNFQVPLFDEFQMAEPAFEAGFISVMRSLDMEVQTGFSRIVLVAVLAIMPQLLSVLLHLFPAAHCYFIKILFRQAKISLFMSGLISN